jgi:hypothetical protein
MSEAATKTVLEQAREAFTADRCPACGMVKRGREDWFCKGCWWKLPRTARATISNQWRGWTEQWQKALAELKALHEKKHPA